MSEETRTIYIADQPVGLHAVIRMGDSPAQADTVEIPCHDVVSGGISILGIMTAEYIAQDFDLWWTPPTKPAGWSRVARRERRRIEKMVKRHRRKWKRKFIFRSVLA